MNRPHSQAEMPSLFSAELPSFLVGTALIFGGNCPQAEMPSRLSVELPSFLVGTALKLKCPHFLVLNCPQAEMPSLFSVEVP